MKILTILLALFLVGNLLAQRYDAGTRPDPEGVPTRVHIALYIIDIESIDNISNKLLSNLNKVQFHHLRS